MDNTITIPTITAIPVPISHATFADLREAVQQVVPGAELDKVERAYEFAARAHAGQSRLSGEPYIQHPLEVALLVVNNIHLVNDDALAATLLHDVMEDCGVSFETLEQEFGAPVARLVDGVTKLGKLPRLRDDEPNARERLAEREKEQQAENLRKMFLAMADDLRVVFIKLADRLHNMRTLSAQPPHKQKRIAMQTLDIYAPLANRLGVSAIKNELEDLCFQYLYPDDYARITRDLTARKENHERYLKRIIAEVSEALHEAGIEAEVNGRGKHAYGVWRKMQRKRSDVEHIYDVLGVRIIVPSDDAEEREEGSRSVGIRNCYAALGVIHSLWRPIAAEFDDYIANPRNGIYRSLHTAVTGPELRPVEVQIRTRRMNEEAEYGIAAHWRYKEDRPANKLLLEKVASLRRLIEWIKEDLGSATEFVDTFKQEAFQDYIYVFTPKGDVIELPAGSTPIDFAYRIHTDLGHFCTQAKVNDVLVPLDTPLQNGQIVSIGTSKNRGGPSRDWLDPNRGFVHTSSARSKIKQWFHRREREENIIQGRRSIDAELRRLGLTRIGYDDVANLFPRYNGVDDFLAAVGYGEVSPQQLATRLGDLAAKDILKEEENSPYKPTRIAPGLDGSGRITLEGSTNIAMTLATCCRPMRGDQVIGYITRGRGLTVHRIDCPNVLNMNEPDRLLKVDWQGEEGHLYPVLVRIETLDRVGILHDITGVIADVGINIGGINTHREPSRGVLDLNVTLEVSGVPQLTDVLRRLSAIKGVYEAFRVRNEEATRYTRSSSNTSNSSASNTRKVPSRK